MSSEKPPILTPYPGRARTQPGADRDVYTRKTPVRGYPIPNAVPLAEFDESNQPATGVVEGDDLRKIRAARPTAARLERLEDKHDKLAEHVADLRQTVGQVSGKLDVLPDLVAAVKQASDRVQEREHLRVVTDIQVDGATKLGGVKAKLLHGEQLTKLLAIGASVAAIVLALLEAKRC